MQNYLKKYKQSKLVLLSLIKDNYVRNCSIEMANNLNLTYVENDISNNSINIYYHNYDLLALLSWDALEIDSPIITDYQTKEIEKNIKNEKYSKLNNYYKLYLKNYLIISKYVLEYYTYEMNIRRAQETSITYRDSDIENEHITFCDHYDSKVGIKVWDFLNIDRADIPRSAIIAKGEAVKEKLLELENIKIDKEIL